MDLLGEITEMPSGTSAIDSESMEHDACMSEITTEENVSKASLTPEEQAAIDQDLIWQAIVGHTERVNILLMQGADVNAKNSNGQTALMLASFNGYDQTVKILLDKGAYPNIIVDHQGNTALMYASRNGHIEIVNTLLTKGAYIDAKNLVGQTALMIAVNKMNSDVVETLIAAGGDINGADEDRIREVFTRAIFRGKIPVVKALIVSGFDVEYVRNSSGGVSRGLDIAKMNNDNTEMINFLNLHDERLTKVASFITKEFINQESSDLSPIDRKQLLIDATSFNKKNIVHFLAKRLTSHELNRKMNEGLLFSNGDAVRSETQILYPVYRKKAQTAADAAIKCYQAELAQILYNEVLVRAFDPRNLKAEISGLPRDIFTEIIQYLKPKDHKSFLDAAATREGHEVAFDSLVKNV